MLSVRQNGRLQGTVKLSLLFPSTGSLRSWTLSVNLTDEQFAKALANGYSLDLRDIDGQPQDLRVVVRDLATGLTGSLQIPAEKP